MSCRTEANISPQKYSLLYSQFRYENPLPNQQSLEQQQQIADASWRKILEDRIQKLEKKVQYLEKENQELREHIAQLQQENDLLRIFQQENQELREYIAQLP
jgi:cell division protein FtsB